MKKIILLLTIILVFVGCSSDNVDAEVVSDGLLLTRVRMTTAEFSSNFYYTYEGNKLVSETHEGHSIIKYSYSGDLITMIKNYDYDNTTLLSTYIYDYDEFGRLVTKTTDSEYAEDTRTVYAYNEDRTIQTNTYSRQGDNPEQQVASGKYHIGDNGEIVKISNNAGDVVSTTFEYDAKKNPFKNATGFSKLVQYYMYGQYTNMTKTVYHLPENAVSTTTISYTYNASGFPTKAVFNLSGTVYTKEFFYQ